MLLGLAHLGEPRLDGGSNVCRVVHAQGGLRDQGQFFGLAGLHARHVGHVFHQVDAAFQLAHGAFHFGVALVADHDELKTLFVQLGHFYVHLGHQRAGGVKNLKAARLRLVLHGFAHAVG